MSCDGLIITMGIKHADRIERGVVAEGPVGCRLAGHFRIFRYEIRRCSGGTNPDLASAVSSPVHLSSDADLITLALDIALNPGDDRGLPKNGLNCCQ